MTEDGPDQRNQNLQLLETPGKTKANIYTIAIDSLSNRQGSIKTALKQMEEQLKGHLFVFFLSVSLGWAGALHGRHLRAEGLEEGLRSALKASKEAAYVEDRYLHDWSLAQL